MSFEISFADVLALGESDEEDPVFEIDIKKKKSHKKVQSDSFKVRNLLPVLSSTDKIY